MYTCNVRSIDQSHLGGYLDRKCTGVLSLASVSSLLTRLGFGLPMGYSSDDPGREGKQMSKVFPVHHTARLVSFKVIRCGSIARIVLGRLDSRLDIIANRASLLFRS